jgi:predicted XRE-type DNA-binding protein
MELTNTEILKLVEKAKKNKKDYVHITDKSKLSLEDKMKMGLCKHFVRYLNEKKIKTSDLAKLLHITQPRVSEIVHYKITKFSLEQLIKNLVKLSEHAPRIREYLHMMEEVTELPAAQVTVSEIKGLTRDISEVRIA